MRKTKKMKSDYEQYWFSVTDREYEIKYYYKSLISFIRLNLHRFFNFIPFIYGIWIFCYSLQNKLEIDKLNSWAINFVFFFGNYTIDTKFLPPLAMTNFLRNTRRGEPSQPRLGIESLIICLSDQIPYHLNQFIVSMDYQALNTC
jgi:hypothetical protein